MAKRHRMTQSIEEALRLAQEAKRNKVLSPARIPFSEFQIACDYILERTPWKGGWAYLRWCPPTWAEYMDKVGIPNRLALIPAGPDKRAVMCFPQDAVSMLMWFLRLPQKYARSLLWTHEKGYRQVAQWLPGDWKRQP